MTLSKVLWTLLTGCVILVTMLLGAWGTDVTSRQTDVEHRMTTAEQHYAVIDQRLADLQQRVEEVQQELRRSGGRQ